MKRNLTTSQKIHFARSANEIESEFALHCYYHSTEVRPDSPYSSVKWSKRHDEISSSHCFGGLIGWEHAVMGWSKGMEIMGHEQCAEIIKRYPELAPYAETPDYYFIGGGCVMHTLASSCIEVAEDGLSAKASFYTPGVLWGNITPTGYKRGWWMWERYGQDWVFEDNEWRVLHNQVMLDFDTDMDCDNKGRDTWIKMNESGWIWSGMMPGPPVEKDIPGPANMDYWPVQIVQRQLLNPEPYSRLEDTEPYLPKPGDGVGHYRVDDLPDNGYPGRDNLLV